MIVHPYPWQELFLLIRKPSTFYGRVPGTTLSFFNADPAPWVTFVRYHSGGEPLKRVRHSASPVHVASSQQFSQWLVAARPLQSTRPFVSLIPHFYQYACRWPPIVPCSVSSSGWKLCHLHACVWALQLTSKWLPMLCSTSQRLGGCSPCMVIPV